MYRYVGLNLPGSALPGSHKVEEVERPNLAVTRSTSRLLLRLKAPRTQILDREKVYNLGKCREQAADTDIACCRPIIQYSTHAVITPSASHYRTTWIFS